MNKFLLVFILSLFAATSLFAEYILEPANCTFKKKINCGAYLYNNKTGATYFCDFEKCKEIMPALEDSTTEVVTGDKKSKKSKIPKFKKKRNLKFLSLKNQNNKILIF